MASPTIRGVDVLVDAVDHRCGGIEKRDLVVALHFARGEHCLLAVADFDPLGLEREEHARLAQVEPERHLRDTLLHEDVLDLLRGGLEQSHLGPDRAAHSRIAGVDMVLVQPRAIELVVARGRAEIPHPRLTWSGEQAIADQLVARPLADDRARDVADIVLVETQHRAETGRGEGLAGAREAVAMQAPEIDALLEVDLRDARCLQRPMPAMARIEVALVDRKEGRRVLLLPHRGAFNASRISRSSCTFSGGAGAGFALSSSRILFTVRTSRNTTKARIAKFITIVRKLP